MLLFCVNIVVYSLSMAGDSRGSRAPLLECGGEHSYAHKAMAPRYCLWLASHVNVRKCVAGIMLLSVLTIFFYTYYVTAPLTRSAYIHIINCMIITSLNSFGYPQIRSS